MAAGYAVNLTIEPSETFMVTHPLTQKFGRRSASGVTGVKVGRRAAAIVEAMRMKMSSSVSRA